MTRWTDEQQAAISASQGPSLVLASAGTGKTAVLAGRILELLRRGYPPSSWIALTFTRDAAREMRARVSQFLEDDLEIPEDKKAQWKVDLETTPQINTLHGFCLHLLQTGDDTKFRAPRAVLESVEQQHLFHTVFSEWLAKLDAATADRLLDRYTLADLEAILHELLERRASWEGTDAGMSEFASLGASVESFFSGFFSALDARTVELDRYGYSDLERGALHLLQHGAHPAFGACGGPDAREIREILVDEFQDTNPSQWALIEALAKGRWEKLFLVGDPKQAIYGFRDADPETLWAQIAVLGASTFPLTANFRATSAVFEPVDRFSASLFQNSAFPYFPGNARNSSEEEDGVEIVEFESETALGTELTPRDREIASVIASIEKDLRAGVLPEKIAILFRVTEPIEAYSLALRKAGIPTDVAGKGPLLRSYAARDFLSFLEAASDPLDDSALAGFLRTDLVAFTPERLAHLRTQAKQSLFEVLLAERPPEVSWYLDRIERGDITAEGFVDAYLSALPSRGLSARPVYAILNALPYPLPNTITELCDLVRVIERHALRSSVDTHTATQGVRLMTVHGSKGLEFESVYLVDLARSGARSTPVLLFGSEGRVGFRYRNGGVWEKDAIYTELAEEKKRAERGERDRLLYVALTRAKRRLRIVLPKRQNSESASPSTNASWATALQGFRGMLPEKAAERNSGALASPVGSNRGATPELFDL